MLRVSYFSYRKNIEYRFLMGRILFRGIMLRLKVIFYFFSLCLKLLLDLGRFLGGVREMKGILVI